MKKSRFKEEQIIAILKEKENGYSTAELARKHGISEATIYDWKKKYNGMAVEDLRKLKSLEQENARLKKMYADLKEKANKLKDEAEQSFNKAGDYFEELKTKGSDNLKDYMSEAEGIFNDVFKKKNDSEKGTTSV